MLRRLAAPLLAAAVVLVAAAPAPAATVLDEGFEPGLGGWTATGLWHVETNPQQRSVLSPAINPNLVTLPDAGQLPSAFAGTAAAWFGDPATGTFCVGHASVTQSAKNGCRSTAPQTGSLTSPAFSLAGAQSAELEFRGWWEIEGVDADKYDFMRVEYSTDGTTWTEAGRLNPSNDPSAEHHEPYSADGTSRPPQWHRYIADISGAIGSPSVRVRFRFDSVDASYQGFRGWLVDAVRVQTPFAEGAPRIDKLAPACVTAGKATIVSVEGANYLLGSKVEVDGAVVPSATPSSTRMEFTVPSSLAAGTHVVRVAVEGPHAAKSNPIPFTVATKCAPPPPGDPAGKRKTALQVRCDRGPNPFDPSKCTATVGDAGAPPRPTPTGRVTFSSADGAFSGTYACTLSATPLSPGVASCVAHNVPAGKDGFASVAARYEGSAVHAPSTAGTGFILAGNGQPPLTAAGCMANGARTAQPRMNNEYQTFNEPGLDWGDVGWCAQTLLLDGVKLTTYVVDGVAYVAPPVAGAAAAVLAPVPEPTAKLAAGVAAGGGVYYVMKPVHALSDYTHKTAETAQQDPPDPNFKRLAKAGRSKLRRLVPGGRLSRKEAKRLTALARRLDRTGKLAQALTATLDRAGGAKLAGDREWERRQMAHAIGLGTKLVTELERSANAIVKARRVARRAPGFKKRFKAGKVRRQAKRIAKKGFRKLERRAMRRLGYTKAEIRTLAQRMKVLSERKGALTMKRPLDALGNPTVDGLRTLAMGFRYWLRLPEVRGPAGLPAR